MQAQPTLLSCITGVTATVTCFPLDVLRTRVMGPQGHAYNGVIDTFRQLIQKEGLGSLYTGLLPAVISMAPAGAVFYGVYDLLKVQHSAASLPSVNSMALAAWFWTQQNKA